MVMKGKQGYELRLDKTTLYEDGYKIQWRLDGGEWKDSNFNCISIITDSNYFFATRIKNGEIVVFVNNGMPSSWKSIGNVKDFSVNNSKGLNLVRLTGVFLREHANFYEELNKNTSGFFMKIIELYE